MGIVHISRSVGGESYFSHVRFICEEASLSPHLTLYSLKDTVASLDPLERKLFIAQVLVYLNQHDLFMHIKEPLDATSREIVRQRCC